jgi:hypothetical protein
MTTACAKLRSILLVYFEYAHALVFRQLSYKITALSTSLADRGRSNKAVIKMDWLQWLQYKFLLLMLVSRIKPNSGKPNLA